MMTMELNPCAYKLSPLQGASSAQGTTSRFEVVHILVALTSSVDDIIGADSVTVLTN